MTDTMPISDALLELRAIGYTKARLWTASWGAINKLKTIYLGDTRDGAISVYNAKADGSGDVPCDSVWIACYELVSGVRQVREPVRVERMPMIPSVPRPSWIRQPRARGYRRRAR